MTSIQWADAVRMLCLVSAAFFVAAAVLQLLLAW
jgi:hypothetical protein